MWSVFGSNSFSLSLTNFLKDVQTFHKPDQNKQTKKKNTVQLIIFIQVYEQKLCKFACVIHFLSVLDICFAESDKKIK